MDGRAGGEETPDAVSQVHGLNLTARHFCTESLKHLSDSSPKIKNLSSFSHSDVVSEFFRATIFGRIEAH